MKINEFKKWFERATQVDIVNDDAFNFAGYFWISLTEIQHKKMYNLLKFQGNKPVKGEIRLKNGLGIINIDDEEARQIRNINFNL